MQTDAIRQDVSQQGDVKQAGEATEQQALSPRMEAMQQLYDQRAKDIADSQIYVVPPNQMQQPADASTATLPEIIDGDLLTQVKVKVKVDGQELELPLSEVTKGYAKDAAASRRLQQAAEERKQLDALKLELAEKERMINQNALSKASLDDGPDVRERIRSAMAALVDGNDDEAADILESVMGRPQATPHIDEEAIIAKAEARIQEKRDAADREKAWQEFVESNADFADETSERRVFGDYLFDTKYGPLMRSGQISYREALNSTAQEVARVFAPQVDPGNPRQHKEDRKRAIDNIPVASGARSGQQQAQAQSVTDVIAEMRKLRGQPI